MSSPAAAETHHARTGLALAVIVIGTLIAAVDTTIVVLALPKIQASLHAGLASLTWVIIGYLLVITLLAIQVGRLGDMFGRVRMYEAGFLVFVVGSALCALSFNVASMIAFRAIQGIGGALISANSGAVIADTFPPERRGRAYGFTAVGWNLGAILGILLGGLITTYISWRWVFGINVPIGLVAFAIGLRVLVDRGERQRRKLDLVGMAVLGLGLFGILWALVQLSTTPLDASITAALVFGSALIVAFGFVEKKVREPMVNLSLLRAPTLTPTLCSSLLQAVGTFAVLFLLTMYLQGVRQLSPIHASALLVPGYLIGALVAPLGGRFADRVGAVIPQTVGIVVMMAALGFYVVLGTTTSLVILVAGTVVNGIGSGLFYPANNAAVMRASPPGSFGVTAGMLRTFANTGMVFSFSVAVVVASRTIPRQVAFAIFVGTTKLDGRTGALFTHGLHAAFAVSIVLLVASGILSATGVLAHRRHQRSLALATSAEREPSVPAGH
ncbi:MAG: MFS transporter [Actinomycetota bacterium]|nr:MFS transporter [Actinomycetota bacterium]